MRKNYITSLCLVIEIYVWNIFCLSQEKIIKSGVCEYIRESKFKCYDSSGLGVMENGNWFDAPSYIPCMFVVSVC